MVKVFKIENLDCAHCALKMERAIEKIEGVSKASVNLLTERLTIEASEKFFETKMKEILKLCKKFDGCEIVL